MDQHKILVVDDEPDLQMLILQRFRKQIRDDTYDFCFAENGEDALDMLSETEDISLVLSDINMPKMDGMECSRRIRAHENEDIKNIPIIAITGNAANYSLDDFKQAGINDYLPKPINFDELVSKVNSLTS